MNLSKNIINKCFGNQYTDLKKEIIGLQFYLNNIRNKSIYELSDYEKGTITFGIYKISLHQDKLPKTIDNQFAIYLTNLQNNASDNTQKLTIIDCMFKTLESASI